MLDVFKINGVDHYLKSQVVEYFKKPIYHENVINAIKTIKAEIEMRKQVFRDDFTKRRQKVREMENVLRIVSRCSEQYEELTKSMFEGGD